MHALGHLTFIQCFLTPLPCKIEGPDPILKELQSEGVDINIEATVCGAQCDRCFRRAQSVKGAPAHFSVKCVLCPAEVWGVHPDTPGSARLRIQDEEVMFKGDRQCALSSQ